MQLKDIICPHCGNKVKIDLEKEINFCFQCGKQLVGEENDISDKKEINLEQKLEEAGFYYQLSHQKKEAFSREENPRYYLKAQDMLLDLSNTFENDYRIWWELSKPLDYTYEEEVNDGQGIYKFNEEYFNRALDLADINGKKQIIAAVDEYDRKKAAIKKEFEDEREKKRREEEIKREEEERKKSEEEARRKETERQKFLQEQKQKQEAERALREKILKGNEQLYEQMAKKDYSRLDCTYFNFNFSEKEYIITFNNIANVLYVTAFYKEKNTFYKEQSQAVHIGKKGEIIKYDNRYLRIRGMDSIVSISSDGYEGLAIGGLKLCKDTNFVREIMGIAKKPLLSLNKIFS